MCTCTVKVTQSYISSLQNRPRAPFDWRSLRVPVHVTYNVRAVKNACIKSRYNIRFSTLFSVDGTVLYCYPQENAAVHKHSWIIKRAQTKPEVPCIAGADPAFRLHTQKMRCQTPHLGSTLPIRRSANGGSDPAIGAGVFRLHGGAKGGSDPAIGSPCKRCIFCSNL